jgi:hypothetical protein
VRTNYKRLCCDIAACITHHLYVTNVATIDQKFLAAYGVPNVLQFALNVLRRSFQFLVVLYIVRSTGDGHHVPSEPRRQIALLGC